MDDSLLRDVCRAYDERRMEQLLQSFAAQPVHRFSKDFEREKRKIIRQQAHRSAEQNGKKQRRISKKAGRILLAAALLLLLLLGSVIAYEPLRDRIFTYYDGTKIIFRTDHVKDSLKEQFFCIPQEYALEKEEHDSLSNYWVYRDQYDNDIVISTSENSGSTVFINTEEVGYEEVDIQGFTGYFVERKDGLILTWSTGKYHHIIAADVTKTSTVTGEDILRIANSRTID